MPLVGYTCPDTGNRLTFKNLLSGKSSIVGWGRDILYKIQEKNSGDYHQNNTVTITSILTCPRKVFLERRVPYYEEPSKLWFSIRGTALHEVLDPHGKLCDWISEKRFYRKLSEPSVDCPDCSGTGFVKYAHRKIVEPCGCCHIGGQIDGLDLKTLTVYDKKSIGDNGLTYIKGGAKEPHVLQTNIYRWVLQDALVHEKEFSKPEIKLLKKMGFVKECPVASANSHIRVGIPVEALKIQYLSMMQVVETGGYFKEKTLLLAHEPERHLNEVSRRVVRTTVDRKTGNPMTSYEIVYKIPNVPIMDDSEIENLVMEKRRELLNGFMTDEAPCMADEGTRKWLCNFCPVKSVCDKINDNPDCKFVFPTF